MKIKCNVSVYRFEKNKTYQFNFIKSSGYFRCVVNSKAFLFTKDGLDIWFIPTFKYGK